MTDAGYMESRMLYEFDMGRRRLCLAASQRTIESLLFGVSLDAGLNVCLYAKPGVDGREFYGVRELQTIPGDEFYAREDVEVSEGR